MAKIHGGQIIARALRNEGVDTLFTLTGGHIVPILDGCLQEGMKIVDVRHEQAAAHAAEAYTRLTGRLGVAAVTAGPGVTDTITAVATAYYGSTPMLVIGGRHLIRQELKGGLQEMDHTRLFHSITRWAATAWQVDRLADYVATAARHAFAGRGGPVFLDVPMDVQFDMVEESAVRFPNAYRQSAGFGVDQATLAEIISTIKGADRVMVFAGAGARAGEENRLAELAEVLQAPTYVNSRARGSLPHGHELLGNYQRSRAMAEAHVVLALGVDWDFRTSYGEKISTAATVIQIDGDAAKVGWNRPAHIAVVADPMTVVSQLVDRADEIRRVDTPVWTKEIMEAETEKAEAALREAADDSPRKWPISSGPTRSSRWTGATSSPPPPGGCRHPPPAGFSTRGRSGLWGPGRPTPSPPKRCSPTRQWASSSATAVSGSTAWSTTPWSASACPSSAWSGTTGCGRTSRRSTAWPIRTG
jgi:acetolactate synthase-1/2/3 large subunit